MTQDAIFDPKGLIREAFVIEGITAPECRSIFLDWALGVPADRDTRGEVRALISHYGQATTASHPMMLTLQAALQAAPEPRRRGGRQGRMAE